MECSGAHDPPRELVQSPQSAQKGQKGASRLSQSFRLGKARLGPPRAPTHACLLPVSPWVTLCTWRFPAPLANTLLFRTDNPSELRPKTTVGGQLNESIFLLRYVQPGMTGGRPEA